MNGAWTGVDALPGRDTVYSFGVLSSLWRLVSASGRVSSFFIHSIRSILCERRERCLTITPITPLRTELANAHLVLLGKGRGVTIPTVEMFANTLFCLWHARPVM